MGHHWDVFKYHPYQSFLCKFVSVYSLDNFVKEAAMKDMMGLQDGLHQRFSTHCFTALLIGDIRFHSTFSKMGDKRVIPSLLVHLLHVKSDSLSLCLP